MAETLVEQRICAKCGADVRKDALFCYNCGGAVEAEIAVSSSNGESVSSGWFRENLTSEESTQKAKDTTKLIELLDAKNDKPIAKPSDSKIEKSIRKPTGKLDQMPKVKPTSELVEKPIEKPIETLTEEPKLKSAATMRRKAKTVEKKRVEEVVWEEHENAPNTWFMLVALLLIAIAGGLFFFAVFVK